MALIDPVIERVLVEFERRAEEEHRRTAVPGSPAANLDDLLLSVGREAGTLLYLLATGAQSRRILELGSSYGYSTVWLGAAARATGGKVTSLELKEHIGAPRAQRVQRAVLRRAIERLGKHPKIAILGDVDVDAVPRIPSVSLLIDGGRLHYGLAARMLSDRFGVQVSAGTACAGAYGAALLEGLPGFRFTGDVDQLGWLRVTFSAATTDDDVDVLLDALERVADQWSAWDDDYRFDERTQTWRHYKDDASASKRVVKLVAPQ
jgi:hypothetical protein